MILYHPFFPPKVYNIHENELGCSVGFVAKNDKVYLKKSNQDIWMTIL